MNPDQKSAQLPTVSIPPTVKISGESIRFSIDTEAGQDYVWSSLGSNNGPSKWRCSGSAESLMAAGFLRPEWLDPTRREWSVVFDEAGPRIRGKGAKGGRPRGEYLHISRKKFYLAVSLPMTDADVSALRRRPANKAEAVVEQPTAFDWLNQNSQIAAAMLDALSERLLEGSGFRYTAASSNRILRAMNELKDAVREGVAAPKMTGNVIRFPRS